METIAITATVIVTAANVRAPKSSALICGALVSLQEIFFTRIKQTLEFLFSRG